MHIDVLSAVPELLDSAFSHSILQRAQDKGLMTIRVTDLRTFGTGSHRQIDDYQYGGGAGMVMMPGPLRDAIHDLIDKGGAYDEVIFLTPDGERLQQTMVNSLSLVQRILLICGHYKGIDQRIRDKYVTREISIGDYVLSGGELPAAVLVDAIGRILPGVIGDGTSALEDSFQDGLLAPPVYTRPEEFEGLAVPDVLMSGDHKKIAQWRDEKAVERTQSRRPDLLD